MQNKIDRIIEVLDQTMIEKGKVFLSLAYANKVLKESNILTLQELEKKTLKNLLENNIIKNAIKTESSPRQWRILPSNNRVKNEITERKVKKNKSAVSSNNNDYWTEYHKKYPNFKTILIIAIIIAILSIIGSLSNDPEEEKYIETRAKMEYLKKQGLATDKDIEEFDKLYNESKKKK